MFTVCLNLAGCNNMLHVLDGSVLSIHVHVLYCQILLLQSCKFVRGFWVLYNNVVVQQFSNQFDFYFPLALIMVIYTTQRKKN